MQTKRRPILLLEVLIAFAIIVLCIFPLIYPHAAMAKAQREFIKKIELDHVVTLLFAQIYQDLLMNKIEWNEIENKKKFEILPQDLQKLNQGRSLPYKGYYRLESIKHKPKSPQETTAYIYELTLKFTPQFKIKKFKLGGSSKDHLEYKYQIFILHDLNKEPNKEETEKQPDEKKETPTS